MLYEPLNKIFYKNNATYETIYKERFNGEFTHRYNFNIAEHQAFVGINFEILNLITSILQLDKRLLKAAKSVPPIALIQFTRKCIVDEIQLTNEIEGVHSTRKEIRELINNKNEKKERKRLYGLVQKYMMLSNGQQINLKTCQDIRTLYDEFILAEVKATDAHSIPDGDIFRKDIVEIISSSQKILHKGLFPESKIITAMTEALGILHDEKINYFVNIAVFHYMFGYIHPFYDGNGRMTRFISSYLLMQQLEAVVGFGLSYAIKNKIKKYYDMFKDTNDYKNKGDLTSFVIGFLEFIEEAIENLCVTIESRAEQFYFYMEKVENYADGNKPIREILHVLLQNALFDEEGINILNIGKVAELSPSTVRAWLKKIPKDMLVISQNGKMNIYSLNLDAMVPK
ncbi:Fic family protein [Pelosinus sp. sgz500959]|uniref:Fic family protein n=1 Tax=Pelosinus sp. sgz500959 TaxID=3242472 RepID=UPI00366A5B94